MWKEINNYLKSVATTIGYNLIYFFSYWQIKYNNLHNKFIIPGSLCLLQNLVPITLL